MSGRNPSFNLSFGTGGLGSGGFKPAFPNSVGGCRPGDTFNYINQRQGFATAGGRNPDLFPKQSVQVPSCMPSPYPHRLPPIINKPLGEHGVEEPGIVFRPSPSPPKPQRRFAPESIIFPRGGCFPSAPRREPRTTIPDNISRTHCGFGLSPEERKLKIAKDIKFEQIRKSREDSNPNKKADEVAQHLGVEFTEKAIDAYHHRLPPPPPAPPSASAPVTPVRIPPPPPPPSPAPAMRNAGIVAGIGSAISAGWGVLSSWVGSGAPVI